MKMTMKELYEACTTPRGDQPARKAPDSIYHGQTAAGLRVGYWKNGVYKRDRIEYPVEHNFGRPIKNSFLGAQYEL